DLTEGFFGSCQLLRIVTRESHESEPLLVVRRGEPALVIGHPQSGLGLFQAIPPGTHLVVCLRQAQVAFQARALRELVGLAERLDGLEVLPVLDQLLALRELLRPGRRCRLRRSLSPDRREGGEEREEREERERRQAGRRLPRHDEGILWQTPPPLPRAAKRDMLR